MFHAQQTMTKRLVSVDQLWTRDLQNAHIQRERLQQNDVFLGRANFTLSIRTMETVHTVHHQQLAYHKIQVEKYSG